MNLLDLFPAWLVAVVAYLAALVVFLRARRDRTTPQSSLIPVLIWLGTVYLFTEFRWFGLDNILLRGQLIRPPLVLLFVMIAVINLAALAKSKNGR